MNTVPNDMPLLAKEIVKYFAKTDNKPTGAPELLGVMAPNTNRTEFIQAVEYLRVHGYLKYSLDLRRIIR